MRLLPSVFVGLLLTTLAPAAFAYGSGATGYTGKQEGRSCNSCHNGGTAPQVAITGPDTLAAGATGDFTMTITTNQARGSGGIAATDGATLAPATGNLIDQDGELTHGASTAPAGGKVTYTFKVTAPANGTTMRLFGVGLASNGNGTGGDSAAQTTKDVAITGGGAAPATPTNPGTPSTPGADDDDATNGATPGGTTTSADATEPSSSKTSKKKKKTSDDEEEDEDYGPRRNAFGSTDASASCSTRPGKIDPAGLGAATGVLFGLALLGRRRRR